MFDINQVPQEMKEAIRAMHAAIRRERKAREQFALWKKEFEIASDLLKLQEKAYGEVSLRWDPEKNVMSPTLETLDANLSEKVIQEGMK